MNNLQKEQVRKKVIKIIEELDIGIIWQSFYRSYPKVAKTIVDEDIEKMMKGERPNELSPALKWGEYILNKIRREVKRKNE